MSYRFVSGCFDGTTQTHDFTVLRNGQVVHLPGVTVGPSTDADGNTVQPTDEESARQVLNVLDSKVIKALQ